GIRRARARKREEDRIFAAGLGEGRNVRRAHERKHEAIRSIRRLRLLLAEQGERLCVEVGGVSIPGDGAVGLRGIEAAEVASPTTAASTATPAEAAASTAKTASAKTTAAEGSAESSSTAIPAKQATLTSEVAALTGTALTAGTALRPHACIEPVIRIHAGISAHLPGLAGNGHRFVAEVGVGGNGG